MKCKTCGQTVSEWVKQTVPEQNLEWGAISDKEMNWESAKEWCEAQGEGWRLPTRVELLQAFEDKVEGFTGNYFWSCTEFYANPANAWYVNLGYGYTDFNTKVTLNYARCVRP